MPAVTPDILLEAYRHGIFPMAESREDTGELGWYDPPIRGILPINNFHIPKRLQRILHSGRFSVTANRDFKSVILGCAASRESTWINDEIILLYSELHQRGQAHSVECWQNDQLVGGLYGVSIGAAFCGESMFSLVPDASKVALAHLAARLWARGYELLDTQFINPHLVQFGGHEILRADYHARLQQALKKECQFVVDGDDGTAGNAALLSAFLSAVSGSLQSTTATS